MKAKSNFAAWLALVLGAVLSLGLSTTAEAQNLPDTIEKIKPAIVAIGTFQRTRRPPSVFRGTGFAIHDGLHIVTNAHVHPEKVDSERKEIIAVFAGKATLSKHAKPPRLPRAEITTSPYSRSPVGH
jgi:S1-C subfamily serine protease